MHGIHCLRTTGRLVDSTFPRPRPLAGLRWPRPLPSDQEKSTGHCRVHFRQCGVNVRRLDILMLPWIQEVDVATTMLPWIHQVDVANIMLPLNQQDKVATTLDTETTMLPWIRHVNVATALQRTQEVAIATTTLPWIRQVDVATACIQIVLKLTHNL